MMYNRYIPQPDGSYRRSRAGEPDRPQPRPQKPEPPKQPPCTPPPPPPKPQKTDCPPNRPSPKPQETKRDSFLHQLLPKDFDTGDVLVIVLLLLMAGDCAEDRNNAILTLALYFLM